MTEIEIEKLWNWLELDIEINELSEIKEKLNWLGIEIN